MRLFFVLLAMLFSFSAYGGEESSVSFVSGSGDSSTIGGVVEFIGESTSAFISESRSAQDNFNSAVDLALASEDGNLDATLTSKVTGESQKVVFTVQGEESSVSLVGVLEDGSSLVWKDPSVF